MDEEAKTCLLGVIVRGLAGLNLTSDETSCLQFAG